MKSKNFLSYLAESKKEYKYTIKVACDEMKDVDLDNLEKSLDKYSIISASKFRSSPIQENPLDFPSMKNTAIHISDVVLAYPVTVDQFQRSVAEKLGLYKGAVVVYSENDPRGIESDLYSERNSDDFKRNYKTALGNDYPEAEKVPAYQDQADSLIKELAKLKSERPDNTHINNLIPKQVSDAAPADNFNDSIKSDEIGFFGRIKKTKVGRM